MKNTARLCGLPACRSLPCQALAHSSRAEVRPVTPNQGSTTQLRRSLSGKPNIIDPSKDEDAATVE